MGDMVLQVEHGVAGKRGLNSVLVEANGNNLGENSSRRRQWNLES